MLEEVLYIQGGRKLTGGKIQVSGSPNQVTKAIIAALLTDEEVLISNAPAVNERFIVENLFKHLGGTVEHLDEHTVRLCAKGVNNFHITKDICSKNRISVLALGPLLHRFQRAEFYTTLGGDRIGARPVDFHLKGLQEMGANIEGEGDFYVMTTKGERLKGAHIVLPFPSVMTTENLLMTATLAEGRTVIENAAIEPEIIELVRMLQIMGADIMYNAHRTFVVNGVKKLRGCSIRCMIDRNEAVSFACAALATGGNLLLTNVPHGPVYSFLNYIQRMGAEFRFTNDGLYIAAPNNKRLKGTHIEVEVHPGFMTDWQQPFMLLFTQAEGVSVLHETIFEDRLKYTKFLNEMGANITLYSTCLGEAPCRFKLRNHAHSAIIYGPTPLQGKAFKMPTDIRAAFCLMGAGLVAEGQTKLWNIQEVQRKYEKVIEKFQQIGADMKVVKEDIND